jgi:aspartate racemase
MGTIAGIDFAQRIIIEWAKQKKVIKEWDYPQFILWSNPKMPSRTLSILNNEDQPLLGLIEDSVNKLIDMGATQVFVPCNTAHYFLRKSDKLKGKYVDIIKMVIDNSTKKRLHILAGEGTREAMLYGNDNVTYENSKVLRQVIELVKSGRPLNKGILNEFRELFRKDSCNILGCTEFSIIYEKYTNYFYGLNIIDPLSVVINKICKSYG